MRCDMLQHAAACFNRWCLVTGKPLHYRALCVRCARAVPTRCRNTPNDKTKRAKRVLDHLLMLLHPV